MEESKVSPSKDVNSMNHNDEKEIQDNLNIPLANVWRNLLIFKSKKVIVIL